MRRWSIFFLLALLLPGLVLADVDCDGVDDVLTSGVALSTLITASAFSVTAWIKLLGSAATSSECWEGSPILSDDGGYVTLGRLNGSTFCGYTFTGGLGLVTNASAAGWTHLALTLGSGTLTLYQNGVAVSTATPPGGTISVMTGLVQLCKGAEGITLADRITEVIVWPSALAPGEIANLGQSRRRLLPRTAPSARWPLDTCGDGASGTGTHADRSGNSRHLTGAGTICRASEYLSRPWGIQ